MQRQQLITVELSVRILRAAMASGDRIDPADVPIRLALRCLWAHCPERWPLVRFWEGGQGTHDFGRSQSMTASINGIIKQLRQSGAWSDERSKSLALVLFEPLGRNGACHCDHHRRQRNRDQEKHREGGLNIRHAQAIQSDWFTML